MSNNDSFDEIPPVPPEDPQSPTKTSDDEKQSGPGIIKDMKEIKDTNSSSGMSRKWRLREKREKKVNELKVLFQKNLLEMDALNARIISYNSFLETSSMSMSPPPPAKRRHSSSTLSNPMMSPPRHSSTPTNAISSSVVISKQRLRHDQASSSSNPMSPPRHSSTNSTSQSSSGSVVISKQRQSMRHEHNSSSAVKKEAQVLTRIAQLQQEGKWSGKLPKPVKEPDIQRAHWAFVLEEMRWLSGVIANEVKAKKNGARKCAQLVRRHFQEKAQATIRAERNNELNRRKISSFMAKEIRSFWGNIEKLFEFRLKTQIDKKRKEALDEHLNFIVDKTEKYSTLLAESLAEQPNSLKTTPTGSDVESVSSKQNDDEYEPDMSSDDDEETIGKDEDKNEEGEIDMLNQEADIPVEELLKRFHPELYDDNKDEKVEEDVKEEEKKEQKKKVVVDDDLEEGEDRENLKALVDEDPALFDAVETAEAFQPTGNTLATTTVKTPVPFLLKHTLREYQHIGLDWLVSLHERSFNGILADEMGLGKTIQTIAMLAHLACSKGTWGPHLIVVPTSVMLNWEMEIKKWAPAFKVLTYYGSQKERRLKRVGWTKQNSFHICITSYKLVIQDHSSFRRKQWYYFILDEAQHIKNFKSQRWQMLLNFSSAGRLLLTGTPLQNNLMELWSLMHFLMPNVFQSHRNFKEWFSNPLTGMVEDSQEYNENLVRRLHKVLRPFLLRRMKNEVEKQLPKKYEHVVYCSLSKRQRYLYDDFMSRAKTKETLVGGNFMSVINCLMQLRKVCNHPNLFEPRPILSPLVTESLDVDCAPSQVFRIREHDPLNKINLLTHPLYIVEHELHLTGYSSFVAERSQNKFSYSVPHILGYAPSPSCPRGKFRSTIQYMNNQLPPSSEFIPLSTIVNNKIHIKKKADLNIRTERGTFLLTPFQLELSKNVFESVIPLTLNGFSNHNGDATENGRINGMPTTELVEIVSSPVKQKKLETDGNSEEKNSSSSETRGDRKSKKDLRKGIFSSKVFADKTLIPSTVKSDQLAQTTQSIHTIVEINKLKVRCKPMLGKDLRDRLEVVQPKCDIHELEKLLKRDNSFTTDSVFDRNAYDLCLMRSKVCITNVDKLFLSRFHLYVPTVLATAKSRKLEVAPHLKSDFLRMSQQTREISPLEFNLQLPEARLIQYDCGKLQTLGKLLHKLKSGGHRVLLFTQMTKVLDILEAFLNYHGYIYLRLDGSTKIEQRQALMERFNGSSKYFCFILSTRSGGVGINLTGADTVVFYDSDWNPTMDAQAQDRCHRIGQTRDVHIYRLVSERTVEENILKKANQKRLLGDLAIDGGNFTTAHLKSQTIRDLFNVTEDQKEKEDSNEVTEVVPNASSSSSSGVDKKSLVAFESAIASVEDATDTEAMILARKEAAAEEEEFDEDGEKAGNGNEDDGFGQLVSQLSPVERFALAHLEFLERDWRSEQLLAAEAELAQQKKDLVESQLSEHEQEQEEEVVQDEEENESETGNEEEEDDTDEEEDSDEESEEEGDSDEEEDEANEEGDGDEEEDEANEEEEENEFADKVASPRTRSRGDVKINLWSLEDK